MDLLELVGALEEIAPPALADEMDCGRIGLIVPGAQAVDKVATALDPTPAAIAKAVAAGANALIVHHTLIWNPITSLDRRLALTLKALLDAEMSLYVLHTNYDRAPGGVNDVLAEALGLRDLTAFDYGRLGKVEPQGLESFARRAARQLGTPVEAVGGRREIASVFVAAGSAFRETLPLAKAAGADALLSSELRHDVIRDRGEVALVSAPHYFTEAPAMKRLADQLNAVVPAGFIDDPPEIRVIGP